MALRLGPSFLSDGKSGPGSFYSLLLSLRKGQRHEFSLRDVEALLSDAREAIPSWFLEKFLKKQRQESSWLVVLRCRLEGARATTALQSLCSLTTNIWIQASCLRQGRFLPDEFVPFLRVLFEALVASLKAATADFESRTFPKVSALAKAAHRRMEALASLFTDWFQTQPPAEAAPQDFVRLLSVFVPQLATTPLAAGGALSEEGLLLQTAMRLSGRASPPGILLDASASFLSAAIAASCEVLLAERFASAAADSSTEHEEEMRRQLTVACELDPLFPLLLRLPGGIFLEATNAFAEAFTRQKTRMLWQFIASQGSGPASSSDGGGASPAQRTSLAVRFYFGEKLQEAAALIARAHSVKKLQAAEEFVRAVETFDEHTASLVESGGISLRSGKHPLAFVKAPPFSSRESELRVRFFCSLVALGSVARGLPSGVSSCLWEEAQAQRREEEAMLADRTFALPKFKPVAGSREPPRPLPLQLLQRLLVSAFKAEHWRVVLESIEALRTRLRHGTFLSLLFGAQVFRQQKADGKSPAEKSSSEETRRSASSQNTSVAVAKGYLTSSASQVAELLGKALALVSKTKPGWHASDGVGKREESFDKQEANRSLAALAADATLWAGAQGFEGLTVEDLALLTFSLIPYWMQKNPYCNSHEDAHVAFIEELVAESPKGSAASVDLRRRLFKSIQGNLHAAPLNAYSQGCTVSRAALALYLTRLESCAMKTMPDWPSSLLFLFAYNLVRVVDLLETELLSSPSSSRFRRVSSQPAARFQQGEEQEGFGEKSQQVEEEEDLLIADQEDAATVARALKAAMQLLTKTVAALDRSVVFPDSIELAASHQKNSFPAQRNNSPVSHGATPHASAAGSRNKKHIRFAGMREVGTFLHVFGRSLRGPPTPDCKNQLRDSSSWLCGEQRVESLGEARDLLTRKGGLMEKIALYFDAIANHAQRVMAFSRGRGIDAETAKLPEAALLREGWSALQTLCKETLLQPQLSALPEATPQPVVSDGEVPPSSWVRSAGLTFGLFLKGYATASPEQYAGIIRSIAKAPLLLVDATLNELFHLLRTLGDVVRGAQDSASPSRAALAAEALRAPPRLLPWALALALLEHAAHLSERVRLSLGEEEVLREKELVLLLSLGEFSVVFDWILRRDAAKETPAAFEEVLRKLVALQTEAVLRRRTQVCEALSLLVAVTETWSKMGKVVKLPALTRSALDAVSDAALEALSGRMLNTALDPTGTQDISLGDQSSTLGRRGLCPFELRRLSTALDDFKHISFQSA